MEFTYCKLIDVLSDIHSGGTPSTEESSYWGGNIKWLSSGETSQRFISDTVDKITEEGVKNSSTKLAKKNNIVMACAGQGKTRGQTSYLLEDMYINQSVIALETNASVLPLYLFYNLSSRYEELRGGSDASSTRGSITTTALKNLPFKYPDLSTQQSIVDILFGYDSLIETNNRRIELLEQTVQELYKEWFVRFRFPGHEKTKFENGLPEGWKIKRMNEFCYVTDGTHDTPKPVDVGVPLVTGRCISSGFVDFDAAYNISEADHKGIKKRSGLKSGDILFSNIGTVGNCCIVDYDREFSVKNVIIFKPETMRDTAYLYYWMTSSTMQEIFGAQTNGASQQFVGLTFMRRYKLLVPKDDILEAFAAKVLPVVEQKRLLHQKNLNLVAQRDMLLPRLMSGKLEV